MSSTPDCASASNSGLKPPARSGSPDNGVVFTPSVVMPIFASEFSKLGNMPKTPMEPVMVEGSAMIRSAAVEIQYPPLAATLHMRSEEHTSELKSLLRTPYAVFCSKKKKNKQK